MRSPRLRVKVLWPFQTRREAIPLSDDSGSSEWVERAETILRKLREIEHASITTDGDEIKEVHIVACTKRRPKQIVRDVESALGAVLKKHVDHRVISVVILEDDTPIDKAEAAPKKVEARVAPREASVPTQQARSAGPTPRPAPSPVRAETGAITEDRIRFISANLFVSGLRTQAQVELSWRGVTRLGSATGASTRDNAERLVATAAVQALLPFLGEGRALALQEVVLVSLGATLAETTRDEIAARVEEVRNLTHVPIVPLWQGEKR